MVVAAADGTPLVTLGRFIGRATNNVAEYTALITAMQEAKKLGATKVLIRGDSELVIKQMTGVYRVKNPDMKVLYDQAQTILRTFAAAKFTHNLRDKNELADALANKAMDRRADVTEIDAPAAGRPAAPRRGRRPRVVGRRHAELSAVPVDGAGDGRPAVAAVVPQADRLPVRREAGPRRKGQELRVES